MLLDGASLWFRSFYAIPEKVTAPDGRPVNALRGFLDTISSLVTAHRPTRLVVCLDLDWRPRFRTDLIPSYKAHRVADESVDGDVEEVPDALTPQVEMILAALACAGIATAGARGCEADDVIGTLAARERSDPVLVVSGDRDLLQVVADEPVPVRVLYVGQGLAKALLMGPQEVADKYALSPGRAGTDYAEMAILRGDPSDGLPGVPGIGEKTAARLLVDYGSLDAIEAAAAEDGSALKPRPRAALLESADYLRAARTVVFVKGDADVIGDDDDRLPTAPKDPAGLERLAAELGVESAVARLRTALGWG
ncbi:5'-3' exonuclease [Gordonia sp. (in: high G+C Gram-positive bacteria)]|uniref:5'-3' exonuclease n=1 Tax=Gordonia sp. (in: high G+C Gram-positive bacteria) TaxID=84139 RepID=UPI0039E6D9CA